MSEVLKLRSSQTDLRIARTVNVLPSANSSRPPQESLYRHPRGANGPDGGNHPGLTGGAEGLDSALRAEYERGVENGRRRTEELLKAQMTESVSSEHQRIEQFFARASEQWSGLLAASEEATVRFAFGVAERIIRKEISQDRSIVVEQIKAGIRRVLGVESVKIRVHPEDLPLVRENKSVIQSNGDAIREIVVEADESLDQGDCIIESDMGTIDARISTQLKQIESALFEGKVVS